MGFIPVMQEWLKIKNQPRLFTKLIRENKDKNYMITTMNVTQAVRIFTTNSQYLLSKQCEPLTKQGKKKIFLRVTIIIASKISNI